MMERTASIVRLGDAGLTVANPDEDIRGRKVLDEVGEEIGEVDGLLLDEHETKVRFMQVAAGGFLGIGEKHFLIPIDAITRIDADHVHVGRSREHVAGSPAYDPALTSQRDIYEEIYGHYGYAPFWVPGYSYPGFPYYI